MEQMYKCANCGHVFSEDEIPTYKDACPTDRGVQILYVSEDCCPECCSGRYHEVYECPICGEWESEDYDEPCERCADEIDYYVANCMALIVTEMNISVERAEDYIENSMWRLTHKKEDIKYLNDVIDSRKKGGFRRNERVSENSRGDERRRVSAKGR